MKVLHLIDSAGLYGAEMVLLTLASSQIESGVSVVVGSIGVRNLEEKAVVVACQAKSIPVKQFELPGRFSIPGIRQLTRYIKEHGVDIVHSHGYKADILLGFLPVSCRGAPMVATVHGYTGGSLKMRAYEIIDVAARRFMQSVIYVSHTMPENKKVHAWPNPNTDVIVNGIPVESEQTLSIEMTEELIQFKGDSFLLLSIGRLSTEKNYLLLLGALRKLVQRGLDVKLVLVGAGGESHSLMKAVEDKNLEQQVLFTGYRKDAVGFMAVADAYVITSLTEGLPITLLEAMRAKLPVVSSAVGGIPRVIKHDEQGLLFESENADELIKCIEIYIGNNQKRTDLAERAYKRLCANFSDTKMCKSYGEVYEKAVMW